VALTVEYQLILPHIRIFVQERKCERCSKNIGRNNESGIKLIDFMLYLMVTLKVILGIKAVAVSRNSL
jgi:hypothetical protein